MIKTTIIAVLLLLLSRSIPASLGAESESITVAGSTNQVLFLQVHLEEGQLTLVKSTLATGVLKSPRRPPAQRVMLSLESTNGTPLWSGWMADPRIQRIEYPDANEPGVLRAMTLTNDPVDFTVRVPQTSGAEKLSFYRLIPPSAQSASSALVSPATNSQTTTTVMEPMGSIVLPKYEK